MYVCMYRMKGYKQVSRKKSVTCGPGCVKCICVVGWKVVARKIEMQQSSCVAFYLGEEGLLNLLSSR